MSRIAVLALQGAFAEHRAMVERLGAQSLEIRQQRDLDSSWDGLILPGGESTVMGRLLRTLDLFHPLRQRIEAGIPVLGTCAGLILLARQVEGGTPCFGTMDLCVKRNAYGRQLGSFQTTASFKGLGPLPMVFIRAPYITQVGPEAEPLAAVEGRTVAARQGNQIAVAFHPELTASTALHQYFLDLCGPRYAARCG